MQGDYPRFKATYTHEELVEHFLLNPAERALVDTCCGDGIVMGWPCYSKPCSIWAISPTTSSKCQRSSGRSSRISSNCLWDHTPDYPWQSRTHDRHLALIRQHTGFRFPTGQDKQELETWLRTHGALDAPTEEDLRECAYARLRYFGH